MRDDVPDRSRTVPEPGGDTGNYPNRRRLSSNLASLFSSQLITWSLTLAWTFIVPRILGPADMGVMVMASSVSTVATVAFAVVTREFLVREMVLDRNRAGGLLSAALLTRLGAIPFALVIAFAYGQLADLDGRAMAVMYLTAVSTGLVIMIEANMATFQAFERMQYIAYTDVGVKVLNTLGGILLVLMGFGILALASLGVLAAAITLGFALWWSQRIVGLGARPPRLAPLLKSALPFWFVTVLSMTYIWIDAILLGLLAPAEVVGWYGAATRLFMTLGFTATIIATASLPRMIEAHAGSIEAMFVVARRSLEWAVIAALALGVGMASVANDLVPLMFGSDFLQAAIPLAVLALGLPVSYTNIIVNQVFIASGRPRVIGTILAIAAVINVALNLWLVPLTQSRWGNGAVGAAISLLLTEVLQLAISMGIMGKGFLRAPSLARIGKALLAATGMALLLLAVGDFPLLLQVLVGAGTFIFLSLLLRLPTPQEEQFFRRRMGDAWVRVGRKRRAR